MIRSAEMVRQRWSFLTLVSLTVNMARVINILGEKVIEMQVMTWTVRREHTAIGTGALASLPLSKYPILVLGLVTVTHIYILNDIFDDG